MPDFDTLSIGDIFNTKVARFVKISDNAAMVLMSSVLSVGTIENKDDGYFSHIIPFSIRINDIHTPVATDLGDDIPSLGDAIAKMSYDEQIELLDYLNQKHGIGTE